jgi:carbonic anhydrase
MKASDQLLLQNKAWADERRLLDPKSFERQSETQKPRFLWVGCADSRVPAEVVTGSDPGEIFVHRNIANVVVATDLNFMSVLSYAVQVLKVEHVIVCGHEGCGGVRAAMSNTDYGMLNKWLSNIKEVYFSHRQELELIGDKEAREDKLISLNARAQIRQLMKMSIIQEAWHQRRAPMLHAWVYHLSNGNLEELETIGPDTVVPEPFRFHFAPK